MRIDEGLEIEKAKARTDVLLDEISIFVYFIARKRQLSERSRIQHSCRKQLRR